MLQKLKQNLTAPFRIFVLQISLVALIIVSVTAVKFLDGDIYLDLKRWYTVNFNDNTDVNEVKNPQKTQQKEEEKDIEKNIEPTATNTVLLSPIQNDINSMCVPLQSSTVSSSFGSRTNPITKKSESHKGLDLSAPSGSGIYAAADGTVELAQNSGSYGNYIIINHSGSLKTLYAHCSKLLVKEGQKVAKGEVIAQVGSTGQSTRPHLHFEVILNGQNLNPEWLINW